MAKDPVKYSLTTAIVILAVIFSLNTLSFGADDSSDTMTELLGAVMQSFLGGDSAQDGTGDTQSDEQLDYYTNPQKEGYYEPVWGAVCRRCGQDFAVSAAEVNENRFVRCPNCQATANPAQAHRDYLFARENARRGYQPGYNAWRSDPGPTGYNYGNDHGQRQGPSYSWKIGGNDDD